MKKVSYDKTPQEVHVPKSPVRSLSSKIRNAVLVTSIAGLVGCASGMTDVKVASLVNVPVSSQKNKEEKITKVEPDLNKALTSDKAEKKQLEKIDVQWLKDLWKKNVGKSGWQQRPDMLPGVLYTPDGLFTGIFDYSSNSSKVFQLDIAYTPQQAIKLQNGAVIGGFILIPGKGANPELKPVAVIEAVKNGVLSTWKVTFDKLAKAYKEATGKDLKYVIPVVEHDVDKDVGEYVQFYIIPADSFDDVKKGNIKTNIPVLAAWYATKDNTLYANNHEPGYITE